MTDAQFQEYIFSWWKTHARDLPWRHTSDPYRILVSEVMLQQTQVSRVVEKYSAFLTAFPTVQSLACAPSALVIRQWKGLGYNRRALYLKKAAERVISCYNGQFPTTEQELLSLPGVGIYTARALMVFAYRQDVSMVDTNIRKIITHFFFQDKQQPESRITNVAERIVPKGMSWEWHQALMDYGALAFSHLEIPRDDKKRVLIPFKETNRYIRGKIIDAVREQSFEEKYLCRFISRLTKRTEHDVKKCIAALLSEHLLENKKGRISLPTD